MDGLFSIGSLDSIPWTLSSHQAQAHALLLD
jgi:hypothetical protein